MLSLGLDISGAAKATFEGHHVLGADALHESSIGLSLEREAHMRTDMGAIMRLYWRSIERTNIVGAIRRFGLLPDLP